MTATVQRPQIFFPLLLLAMLLALALGAVAGFVLGLGLTRALDGLAGLNLRGAAALGLPYLFALLGGAGAGLALMWASIRWRGGFQGGHAAVCFVSIFGTIFFVNFVMASQAVRSFPGLVVANSYIASQSFDDRREAQAALGWAVDGEIAQGSLWLRFSDAQGPVFPAEITAIIGRPTHQNEDQALIMTRQGEAFIAPVDLARGMWTVRLEARAEDGTLFEHRVPVSVR